MVVVNCPERSHPCRRVYCIIVSEFGLLQEFDTIVLLVVVESPEILLHRLILTLCLPVCPWMKGLREPMVSTQVWTYPCPESSCKLGAAISEYVIRNATLANHLFKEELGQLRQVDILLARYVYCYLSQSVHDNENHSVARCRWLWQVSDEVHCDAFPWRWWCLQQHVDPMPGVPRCFDWVAYFTAADIRIYVRVHCWPVEIPRYQVSSFMSPKMTGLRVVME